MDRPPAPERLAWEMAFAAGLLPLLARAVVLGPVLVPGRFLPLLFDLLIAGSFAQVISQPESV